MWDSRALTVPVARGGDEDGDGASPGDGPINEDEGGGMGAFEELEATSSAGAVGGAWGRMRQALVPASKDGMGAGEY